MLCVLSLPVSLDIIGVLKVIENLLSFNCANSQLVY